MKTFVISDLHFGHANIIKMCKRPFKDIDDMDNKLIDNWNKVVGKNDIVYVLGDFSFKGRNLDYYLDKLNGKIILIKGNHDKYFRHNKIISIHDYLEIQVDNVLYVLSHYPMTAWNHAFKDSIHLYGHVHNTGKDWEFVKLPNAHSVCCEFYDYTPIEITKFKPVKFVEEMKKKGLL
ncbi:MAG: metallophosphoesterase family protein [Clostridium chrysemydis]|uniref:metallophosphoesterase family protein n=1 Tax=Clostridium chrysemydis TaxID=2665504 RepID=UPI003F2CE888